MGNASRTREEGRRNGQGPSLLFTFLLILILHCVAILLFTGGFLLTRTELAHYSNSSDISQSPCIHPFPTTLLSDPEPSPSGPGTNFHEPRDRGSWTKPAVDKIVIIIVDALRFDFVAPSTFFAEKRPWMDRLQVLHKVASREGASAMIFKAIADPPTTTLQRLKGLTTGGIPTFIDVGNSFGAPAIVEDNMINQLVKNGKRVVMMGDDTWLQLFPNQFNKSYPFPSFNVKDLDTVDNGCIEHLFPSLHEDDWDVLIAHFLGVDHAGHIFSVDSTPMIEKLEQYNAMLEKVIEVLESQSGPGGLHENSLLLVIGDHGQTINGDHGGGTAEEVETAVFAMGFKNPSSSLLFEQDTPSCQLDLDGEAVCIRSIEQLDFAVTLSALMGVPFPFGSIGHVNADLYALAAATWYSESLGGGTRQSQSNVVEFMHNYVNVLCMNSWQVKRYIDVYSASSAIGFSNEDLLHLSSLYDQAMESWSHTVKNSMLSQIENYLTFIPNLRRQIDAYMDFLASVTQLARSKWTEFNLKLMITGFSMMLISLFIHIHAIRRLNKLSFRSVENFRVSFGLGFSCVVVVIRACSFLSNSYILEEGKVATFLAATTGMISLRQSLMKNRMQVEAVGFLFIISMIRFAIELGLSKQATGSVLLNIFPSWMHIPEMLPVIVMLMLTFFLHKVVIRGYCKGILKYVIIGTIFSYILIAVFWASESELLSFHILIKGVHRNIIPKIVYILGVVQLLLLVLFGLLRDEQSSNLQEIMHIKTVAMLSAWSSTIILLSGRQGPFVAVASIVGGWCIVRLKGVEQDDKDDSCNSFPVTQWSIVAVSLFFCTGHWCAFDGIRYAAAFVGFEEFILIPQAILLTTDTFGFSHIVPIFGLAFLVEQLPPGKGVPRKKGLFFIQLCQAYLMYGLIAASTATVTLLCVTIHRRHLMVWGLFTPKFVFDALGLILTDVFILLALLYYYIPTEVDESHD